MTLRLAALAAIFTWSVCRISWPGFMSFDSMYALRQARTGIETGVWPPMVSYLWVLCEQFIPGQGGMFIFGNALVFVGVAALGRAVGAGDFRILLAMLLVAWAPVTLGPMLVVWKDVAFGGLMAIAYAVTLRYVDRHHLASMAAAMALVTLASSFRLNGVAAAVPALAAIAWTMCMPSRADRNRTVLADRKRLLASFLLFLGLVVAIFGFVMATSTWRLPDLKRIETPTGNVGGFHDLLGISICVGHNLLPPSTFSGEMTLERLRHVYHPEHVFLSFGPPPLLDGTTVADNARVVQAATAAAMIEHPWCYLQHRGRIFLHGIGANAGPVFYLVDTGVFPGEAFTELTPTELTASVVSYVVAHESSMVARSFFYALLAIVALAVATRGAYRTRMWKALLPMAGAGTYMVGSFFVLPAADARYNFWPNLVFMVTFCCVMPFPKMRAAVRNR